MRIKKIISVLLALTLVFGTIQSVFGFSANAVVYDSTVLNYMINNHEAYRQDRYTEDSWQFYLDTLAAVTAVNEKADATADEINAAVADLAAAEAALTYLAKPYKSALNLRVPDTAILAQTVQVKFKDARGNSLTNIQVVEAEGADVGEFAIGPDAFYTSDVVITGATGTTVSIKVSYDLEGVTYTFNMYILVSATAKSAANKAQLGALIARETALNRQASDYNAGFQTYTGVMKGAIVNYINTTTTQTKVDRAVENIGIAVNSLVSAYADYSRIYTLIAQANELNPENYDSFTAVTNAIALIEYDLPADDQDYVDSMADNLQQALDNLKLKTSRYTVKCISYNEDGSENVIGTATYDGTRTYVVRVTAPVYPGYEATEQYQTVQLTQDEQTVTFVYEPVTYYAYFNANGGKVDLESKELTYNAEYGELPVAYRDGYAFLGWFSDAVGGEQIVADTMVTVNYVETLYAHWSDVEVYTFKFDSNGGSACEDLVSAWNEEISLPTPYLYGYSFLGWYYADGTKADYTTMPDLGDDGTVVTLTAKWTPAVYDVTLDAGEGSVSDSSYTVTYGTAYGAIPNAEREGYTFNGWFTEKEGGTKITSASMVELEAAHTLYAQYTINQYTLYFDMDDGDEIAPITQDYGTPIVLEKEPHKEFYLFAGWTLNGEPFDLKTMPAGNVTIKAVWTLNAKTTYYLDAYKTVNGVRIPARNIAPGELIEVEVSLKTNYPAGQAYIGILFDKRVFIPATNTGTTSATLAINRQCYPNTTSDYINTLRATTIAGSNNYSTSNWGSIITDDPLINTSDFKCIRPQTQAANTAKTPVVISEKTLILTAYFKVQANFDASILSGVISIDERLCKTPENSTAKYPTYVTNQKYNPVTGVYDETDTVNLVPDCSNATLDMAISAENSELGAISGSTTVVDYDKELVYGLAEELTLASFKADYATVIGTGTIECADSVLKTGSVIKVMNGGVCKAEYTVVIYGDLNSDGAANGEDAMIANLVSMGVISADSLTAAQKEASDPNHDGKIDAADVLLLEDAGLLKETVSQK